MRVDRLKAYCEQSENLPFVWGQSDCTIWVYQWVKQELEIDLNLPKFNNKKEAVKIIKPYKNLYNLWSSFLKDFEEIDLASSKSGDIGIVTLSTGRQLGFIVTRPGIVAQRTKNGIRYWTPNPNYVKVWSL